MPLPCRLLLIPALLAATALHSIAGQSFSPTTDSSSGVSVRVESWLESCPSSGLVPLRLHVTNRSANTLGWEITAAGGQLTTRGTLTVEGGRDGEMALYAMTPPMERSSGFYRNLTVTVNGPGISNNFAGQLNANTGGGSNHTEFIGMSKKLAAKGWSGLKAKLTTMTTDPFASGPSSSAKLVAGPSELDGSEVDMTQAPDDWRGYAGLAQLWMDEGEWLGMSAQSKAALLDWVAMGGRVCIMVSDISDARHLELKLPPLVKNKNHHGAGQFSTFQWDGKTLPIDIIA